MVIFKTIFAANLVILALGQVPPQQVDLQHANHVNVAGGNPQIPSKYAKASVQPQWNVSRPVAGNQANYIQVSDDRAGKPILQSQLASSEECAFDANRLCGDKLFYLTDLEVLSCITDKVQNDSELRDNCRAYLREYKLNITKIPKFTRVTKEVCKKSLEKFPQCNSTDKSDGKMIPCLLEHKQKIEYRPCYHFLIKMAKIIISDYHLIRNFMNNCKRDIRYFQCAPSNVDESREAMMSHTQGEVIHCLEDVVVEGSDVRDECVKQIARIAEFSSDDYHLDRSFYFACKSDRKTFCENVIAGEGKVYRCLFQHKYDSEMSLECRNAITQRQRFIGFNYKASYALSTYCGKDIEGLACASRASYKSIYNDLDIIGLAGILLCIEDAKQDGRNNPSLRCESQLREFRQMLADDYQLSPEIVRACGAEIQAHCTEGFEKDTGTIHCLMALAQNDVLGGEPYDVTLSDRCVRSVIHLLKASHAVSDYRMNRVLATACDPVVETACRTLEPGDPLILSCLMEHIYSKYMTDDCRRHVLEIQYFLTRDLFLDKTFLTKCNEDARILCFDDMTNMGQDEATMPFSLAIACLYRRIPNVPGEITEGQRTSPGCAVEIKNAMKFRAINMNLNPELEKKCVHALQKYCSSLDISDNIDIYLIDIYISGSEFTCLQDHFENITADIDSNSCVEQIEFWTQIQEAEMSNLDDALLNSCAPDIDRFCDDEQDRDIGGEVMQCLYNNKEKMSRECEAGVTHLQVIKLKNINFNYIFMKACKGDITKHCMDVDNRHPTKKNEIIECLSELHLTSVLHKRTSEVSEECIAQLTSENLRRHDVTLKFNLELLKACKTEFDKYCRTSQESGLESLRRNSEFISPRCRIILFKLQKQEAIDPNLDVALMKTCKSAIMSYCGGVRGNGVGTLDCLIESKNRLGTKCHDVVTKRERERFSNIKLNPGLLSACKVDIEVHCARELGILEMKNIEGEKGRGEVISCLKDVEAKRGPKLFLLDGCARRIRFVMNEQQNMYLLDPILTSHCAAAINKSCTPETTSDVVECLKMHYVQNKFSNNALCMFQVAKLLKQGRSVMMADPVLHSACSIDIQHYCDDLHEGEGRIVSCILDVVEGGGRPVTKQCSDMVSQRVKMWKYASENNFGTFGEIPEILWVAKSTNSFLSVKMLVFAGVLFLMMYFGLMRKRVPLGLMRKRVTREKDAEEKKLLLYSRETYI